MEKFYVYDRIFVSISGTQKYIYEKSFCVGFVKLSLYPQEFPDDDYGLLNYGKLYLAQLEANFSIDKVKHKGSVRIEVTYGNQKSTPCRVQARNKKNKFNSIKNEGMIV